MPRLGNKQGHSLFRITVSKHPLARQSNIGQSRKFMLQGVMHRSSWDGSDHKPGTTRHTSYSDAYICLVAWPVLIRNLNQSWDIVNWILRIKFQWKINSNSDIPFTKIHSFIYPSHQFTYVDRFQILDLIIQCNKSALHIDRYRTHNRHPYLHLTWAALHLKSPTTSRLPEWYVRLHKQTLRFITI